MIAHLRANQFDRVLHSDSVWLCVSCFACAEVCPAKIPLTAGMMTRAKEELLLAGNVPAELQEALINSFVQDNEATQRIADVIAQEIKGAW